ncbi:MAG: hypothetical protein LBG88_02390 [Christensenellaceae bacterium]|jgi:hypothetical protein|nr:hypothetical protein [Christensenellaceae bacterium]
MNTIKIKVEYQGDFLLNNEHTCKGPVEILWFPNVDLLIETQGERIVVNTDQDEVIIPRPASGNLEVIKNIDIQLVKNNMRHYILIGGKVACPLPADAFQHL